MFAGYTQRESLLSPCFKIILKIITFFDNYNFFAKRFFVCLFLIVRNLPYNLVIVVFWAIIIT